MATPALRPRRTFPAIGGITWEHPADRAALQALRSVPGFEEITKKILAFLGGERGIRLLFQANAVRVGYACSVFNQRRGRWRRAAQVNRMMAFDVAAVLRRFPNNARTGIPRAKAVP